MKTARAGIGAGLLIAIAACASIARTSEPVAGSLVAHVPVAPTPVRTNGSARLVYELQVSSEARSPLRLHALRVLDPHGARVAELRGETLARAVAQPDAPSDAVLVLAPGARAVVYLEIDAAPDRIPDSLVHELEYAREGAAVETRTLRPVAVRTDAPLPVLGAPVGAGTWVAVYHPAWPRGHRRVLYTAGGVARIPGRHAIDWIRVDADGRIAAGDPDLVANWLGQRQDVLAVADAEVVALRNDVSESPRISTHPQHSIEDATGNYVALALGGGRYAFYEHLAPNSITVHVGERVRRGQVIAAVGFTGHSTGPHLHFHVADANSPLGAEGMPFLLDCFEVLGVYDDIASLGKAPWRPAAARRSRELPAPNTVLQPGC